MNNKGFAALYEIEDSAVSFAASNNKTDFKRPFKVQISH